MNSQELRSIVGSLLSSQKLAVLASYGDCQPYTSLVAFAESPDLTRIYFATTRKTRKFANLNQCPKVSLLIDNRSNRVSDFDEAIAATVIGGVSEVDKKQAAAVYLGKHPYLADFIDSPDTALLQVAVEKYFVVSKFRQVLELDV